MPTKNRACSGHCLSGLTDTDYLTPTNDLGLRCPRQYQAITQGFRKPLSHATSEYTYENSTMASIAAINRTFYRENRSMTAPRLRVDTTLATCTIQPGHQLSRDDPPSPPPQPPPSPVGWAYATSDNHSISSLQVSRSLVPAVLIADHTLVRRPSQSSRGLDR